MSSVYNYRTEIQHRHNVSLFNSHHSCSGLWPQHLSWSAWWL